MFKLNKTINILYMSNTYQIYLISDSTGETLDRIFTAIKAQFKNIDYKIEHPIFSTDQQGKPIISYIDQFPEPQSLKQGLYLNSLSESLEGSKKLISFKLLPGYAIFSNNYFMLHGRKAFKPHPKLSRELLRQRGIFYK